MQVIFCHKHIFAVYGLSLIRIVRVMFWLRPNHGEILLARIIHCRKFAGRFGVVARAINYVD
jgi:hypothetical protein